MTILSKGEFRDLPHLRHTANIDITNMRHKQIYAVVSAYDAVIDELIRVRDERDAMRRDITAAVTCLPVDGSIPKVRLVLVAMLIPWVAKLFGHIKKLCDHVHTP